MNAIEFSNQFDILYNQVMSNASPSINEYEKSYLLTKAQDELVKNYFNPKGNKYQEGFDNNTKRQIGFANLICSFNPILYNELDGYVKANRYSKLFIAPSFDPTKDDIDAEILPNNEILFILNEGANVTMDGIRRDIAVMPIEYNEYLRFSASKPYQMPNKNRAWRLLRSYKNTMVFEIIKPMCLWNSYTLNYVRKPKPIILTNLNDLNGYDEYDEDSPITNGLTINGYSDMFDPENNRCCELDDSIHEEILQRAVELAKGKYIDGALQTSMALGGRSE